MTRFLAAVLLSLSLGGLGADDSSSDDTEQTDAAEASSEESSDEEDSEEDEDEVLEPLSEGKEKVQSNADVALPQDI